MALLRQLEQNMQQFQGYCKSETRRTQNAFSRVFSTNPISHKISFSKPKSKAEAKQLAAKKHSEAERRRRSRINGQYATLRNILPNLIKMDKAAVLAETVRQVRQLRKTVSALEAGYCGGGEDCVFPGETDKLSLENCEDDQGLVKVTFSCEDRPGLMTEVASALRTVEARVVKSAMVTVGGRTKSVLWTRGLDGGKEGLVVLRRALKMVIDRPIFQVSADKYKVGI